MDFGNRDFAALQNLKLLPTDALIPPALATRAKVHGLRNEFGKNVFDFVHNNTVERPLHGILKGTWKDEATSQVGVGIRTVGRGEKVGELKKEF